MLLVLLLLLLVMMVSPTTERTRIERIVTAEPIQPEAGTCTTTTTATTRPNTRPEIQREARVGASSLQEILFASVRGVVVVV